MSLKSFDKRHVITYDFEPVCRLCEKGELTWCVDELGYEWLECDKCGGITQEAKRLMITKKGGKVINKKFLH